MVYSIEELKEVDLASLNELAARLKRRRGCVGGNDRDDFFSCMTIRCKMM